LTDTLHYR